MTRITKLVKLLGMSMAMTMAACKQAITMKTLVLTTHQIDREAITLNLQSYGIPYDVIELSPTNLLEGNLTLYNENNEPKYNLVVVNGGDLILEIDNMWKSVLSPEQWAYLEEYEAKYSVRRVVISEDIPYNPQFELQDPNNWGETLENQPLIVEESDEVKGIFKDARVKITAPLNVNNIYHTGINILNKNITSPFLYYSKDGKKGPVAAAITKYEDGREKMSFFFGLGTWSQSSIIINHLWLAWGTRSLFNGFRRVYFTPHIDDIFLATELVDPKTNEMYPEDGVVFRTEPSDFQKIAKFQKDVLDIMPKGSFYRVELAFNGNGMLISTDYDRSIQIDTERYVDLEYVMEPGKGEKRWPKENYKFSSAQLSAIEKDDLYKFFNHNETIQNEFFWSSHTFTHENLDNVSRSDVDNEIRLNIELAEKLGLTEKKYWSGGSIITPQISGLHSKDALEIFRKYGINSATGDLSRPAICNLENPYLPFYTTIESSNLEGFPIIPRTPTEIYYFASTKEEDTWVYNQIYHDYFGVDSTFDEIMQRESERTTLLMTKLRHEAHQFHQANLRYYPKEGKYGESLLEDWTRSVVSYFTKFVDWPLVSVSLNEQAETFTERAKLESCGHETQFIVEDNKVVGITVSASKGECTVPVTIPTGVKKSSLPDGAKLEQLGNDPLTVWVPLKKGESKSFKLEPAFEWTVKESSEPTTTVVIEPTTTVVESTTVVEPTTSVVESTTTVVEPTTSVVESTTTVVEPTTTVVEPITTVVESTTTVVEPTTTVVESTTAVTETETITSTTSTTTTTTTVKPTDTCENAPFYRCGGIGFVGSNCCTKGHVCKYQNPYYYQCVAEDSLDYSDPTKLPVIITTTTPVEQPTEEPEPDTCENGHFAKCGGIGFTGPKCCKKGFICQVQNPYYHQCVALEDYEGPTLTEPEFGDEPTTIVNNEPTATTEPDSCENGPFARCGGDGYEGPTCCPKGHVCFPHNQWYYQCISDDSVDQFLSLLD